MQKTKQSCISRKYRESIVIDKQKEANKLNKQFEKIIKLHEEEDSDYIYYPDEIVKRLKEEVKNADDILALLESDKDFKEKFFDYSKRPLYWGILPIRTSNKFFVKKHTLTQRPYFHTHDFYELIYVHKGKCIQYIYTNNEMIIGEKALCVISPKGVHALARSGKKDIIFKIAIPKELFDRVSQDIIKFEEGDIKVFEHINEQAEYCISKIMQECYAKADKWEIASEKYLGILFLELGRTYDKENEDTKDKIQEYLNLYYRNASLYGFASFIGYSTGYAGRFVKKNTGQSFSDILSEFRLKKAKEMLTDTDMSIERIALSLGYKNTSGFYKQFCRSYGITPNEYRKTLSRNPL